MGLMRPAQSVAGVAANDAERLAEPRDPQSWGSSVAGAGLWSRTLRNRRSEFLAAASMVGLSIYLRQRGSPESKPVGGPHDTTGVESCPVMTATTRVRGAKAPRPARSRIP